MNFDKLNAFVSVCECGNISKAAEKLYVSQPSLSRTIATLEHQHGCTFFDRSGNRISLNSNGKKFYRFAKKTLKDYDALCKEFFSSRDDMTVCICSSNKYFADFIIPEMIRSTSWHISVKEVGEAQMPEALNNGIVDIGFSNQKITARGIQSQFLYSSEVFVSIPNSNPLSKRNALSLSDLDGEEILYLENDVEYLRHFKQLLKEKAPGHRVENSARRATYELLKKKSNSLYFLNTYERLFIPNETKGRSIVRINDVATNACYIVFCEDMENVAAELIAWINEKMKRQWHQITRKGKQAGNPV